MDLGFVIVNALTLACIYGTLAIAISITWSSLGLINMAYGFIFAFAGYAAWLAGQTISDERPHHPGRPGILAGAVAGIIVCALAFIPIHDKPELHRARHDRDAGDQPDRQPGAACGGSGRAPRSCPTSSARWKVQARRHRAHRRQDRHRACPRSPC